MYTKRHIQARSLQQDLSSPLHLPLRAIQSSENVKTKLSRRRQKKLMARKEQGKTTIWRMHWHLSSYLKIPHNFHDVRIHKLHFGDLGSDQLVSD